MVDGGRHSDHEDSPNRSGEQALVTPQNRGYVAPSTPQSVSSMPEPSESHTPARSSEEMRAQSVPVFQELDEQGGVKKQEAEPTSLLGKIWAKIKAAFLNILALIALCIFIVFYPLIVLFGGTSGAFGVFIARFAVLAAGAVFFMFLGWIFVSLNPELSNAIKGKQFEMGSFLQRTIGIPLPFVPEPEEVLDFLGNNMEFSTLRQALGILKVQEGAFPEALRPLLDIEQPRSIIVEYGVLIDQKTLGTNGEGAIPLLSRTLYSADKQLRNVSYDILYNMGSDEAKYAIHQYFSSLSLQRTTLRQRLLKEVGSVRMVPDILRSMLDVRQNTARVMQYVALVRSGEMEENPDRAIPLLIEGLRDSDKRARNAAYEILYEMKSDAAQRALQDYLQSVKSPGSTIDKSSETHDAFPVIPPSKPVQKDYDIHYHLPPNFGR